jgi:protein TonB
MNAEQILSAGVLDILFEGRNKSYGAYPLRKYYHRRLLIAVILIITISTLFFGLINLVRETAPLSPAWYVVNTDPTLAQIINEAPKLDLPKPSASKSTVAASAAAGNDVNSRNLNFTDDASRLKTDPPAITGPELQPSVGTGTIASGEGFGSPGPVISSGTTIPKIDSIEGPVMNPEVMPSFPGGEKALIRFLQRNLHIPEALEPGSDVHIMAQFVINVDGKLTSVTTNGNETVFDREVRRVINKMPEWIPGKTNGKSVACYFQVPVVFHIDPE